MHIEHRRRPVASSRTALWSLLAPVLLAAGATSASSTSARRSLEDVADRLDEVAEACRPSSESFVNPAKILAADLAEGVPVVLGDGPLNGVAAMRAASMLARTARMPAICGELPDDASQIVACFDGPFTSAFRGGATGGWAAPEQRRGDRRSVGGADIFADPFLDGPAGAAAGPAHAARLRPRDPSPEAAERTRSPRSSCPRRRTRRESRSAQVTAQPGHPLVRLAGQIATTDFAATYLALGLGLDPSVSPHVADLGERTGR